MVLRVFFFLFILNVTNKSGAVANSEKKSSVMQIMMFNVSVSTVYTLLGIHANVFSFDMVTLYLKDR